ncbi:MAG: C40 family peptidase [Candidatus Lloydbacteria bacterium]|nr:C40 family peptidase [Candidatus Lloydbacteria bacterium]
MTISYNWLQSFFNEKLPAPEKVAELLTMHAFEVESFEKKGGDTIFEIDILPNRAHDCLSHRGVAKELGALLKLNFKFQISNVSSESQILKNNITIKIEDEKLCRRYIGRIIEGVKVGPSSDWLREHLLSIGQKSINNVVDATNYVMFHLGQPLHAFDLAKIESVEISNLKSQISNKKEIIVRMAREGERITTLDKKEVMLDSETLVIADKESPLAIAGIKGGMKAEVNEATKNIILESANFEPTNIRLASRALGIRTDSSKRFEQGLAPELALETIELATKVILEIAGGEETAVGDMVDEYPRPGAPYKVGVSLEEINSLLGLTFREKEVKDIFDRLDFSYEIVDPIKKVLELAPSFSGVPYRHGASVVYDAPRAFDCSSFTAYLFAQAGIAIPRMSVDQYVFGREVPLEEMMPGDIIFSNGHQGEQHTASIEFFSGTKVPQGIDHCGLYLGGGKIIHALRHNGAGAVLIEALEASQAFADIVGARRMYEGPERFVVNVPHERLDIRIAYDLIEEIGRMHGYGGIPEALPNRSQQNEIESPIFYQNVIREILANEGFSEVYTYTFVDKQDGQKQIELENPLAADKAFLRGTLALEFFEKFETNAYYSDFLGIDTVKIFEIGRVFSAQNGGEREVLGIGVKRVKKGKKGIEADELLTQTLHTLFSALGLGVPSSSVLDSIRKEPQTMSAFIELPFEDIAAKIDKNTVRKLFDEQTIFSRSPDVSYQPLSKYPFVVRDIAVFVPQSVEADEIASVIKNMAGQDLVRYWLFDTFEKDDKKSFAFRLIFQSHEKTLSDDEVNIQMNQIYQTIEKRLWKVR